MKVRLYKRIYETNYENECLASYCFVRVGILPFHSLRLRFRIKIIFSSRWLDERQSMVDSYQFLLLLV